MIASTPACSDCPGLQDCKIDCSQCPWYDECCDVFLSEEEDLL